MAQAVLECGDFKILEIFFFVAIVHSKNLSVLLLNTVT